MNREKLSQEHHLSGFITEQHFEQAEEAFPGIATFYKQCGRRPSTFLELVWQFERALAAFGGRTKREPLPSAPS